MISYDHKIQISAPRLQKFLSKLEAPLKDYVWIQNRFEETSDPQKDFCFRKRFNRYYRVRRNSEWQDAFYGLMGECKNKPINLKYALSELQKRTSRIEASFASKLIATLDPRCPVIDSVVFNNLELQLPKYNSRNRIELTCEVYHILIDTFARYLATQSGEYLVSRFRKMYPNVNITETKMLDLVLWQIR